MMDLGDLSFRPTRVSDQVEQVLKNLILEGKIGTGDRLPTEAQLAELLNVSKSTVREALKHMEAEGVIEKRRGATGGNFASTPGSHMLSSTLRNFYDFGTVTYAELLDFRKMLEPVLVSVAAERRTTEDLKAMEELIASHEASLNAGKNDVKKSVGFHRLIANACHNVLVSSIIEGLMGVYETVLGRVNVTLEEEKLDLEFNRRFLEAIRNNESDKSRALMLEHFEMFRVVMGDEVPKQHSPADEAGKKMNPRRAKATVQVESSNRAKSGA